MVYWSNHRVRRANPLILGFGAILLLTLRCGAALQPGMDSLAIGEWGGDGVGVIVTATGVHIHIGCTNGDIPGSVELDDEGRFTVAGNYLLQAFPVAIGPTMPAEFSGKLTGRSLTFSVVVSDTVDKELVALGPATVVFGRHPDLGACPICEAK